MKSASPPKKPMSMAAFTKDDAMNNGSPVVHPQWQQQQRASFSSNMAAALLPSQSSKTAMVPMTPETIRREYDKHRRQRTGPSSAQASPWLTETFWYEGPKPPLGYGFYHARWQANGLNEPLYAIVGKDGAKRRQRFVAKMYAILTVQIFLMAASVGIYDGLTPEPMQKQSMHKNYIGIFVGIICVIAMTMLAALLLSPYRRLLIPQIIVTVIYSFVSCTFAVAAVSAIRLANYDHLIWNIQPVDVWIGLTQCSVSFLFVIIFCLQTKVEIASWTGSFVVFAFHLTTDGVCLLIYHLLMDLRMMPGFKMSMAMLGIAMWTHFDIRRMICDHGSAISEEEYFLAAFQVQVDAVYFPCYFFSVVRHGSKWIMGSRLVAKRKKGDLWGLPNQDVSSRKLAGRNGAGGSPSHSPSPPKKHQQQQTKKLTTTSKAKKKMMETKTGGK